MLDLFLFGPFAAQRGGKKIACGRDARGRSLLKYLALHRNQAIGTDALVELFWPHSAPGAGKASLQAAISYLRRGLEPELKRPSDSSVLLRQGDSYVLTGVETDYHRFLERAQQAEVAAAESQWQASTRLASEALALVQGELLACEPYAQWAQEARHRFVHHHGDLLELLLTGLIRLECWREAILVARRALEVDPVREELYRNLMIAYVNLGEMAMAARTYHRCRLTLVEELGIEPSAATVKLYQSLLAHG